MKRRERPDLSAERGGHLKSRRKRVVIDDTLATTAVFDMTPDEIQGDALDPDGLRVGEEVAEALLEELKVREEQDSAKPPIVPALH